MSLVTKKAQLCTTKVTSVIMHGIFQRKEKILKAGGIMETVTNEKYTLYTVFVSLNIYCTEEQIS